MTLHDHLNWALSSPNLIRQQNAPFSVIEQPSVSDINILARTNEDQLAKHLGKNKSHFLGSYFESLWQFYLQQSERYHLIASNLQFHQQGKTLGELDFIVFDHQRGITVHQEIAIKLYLGNAHQDKSAQDASQWIGPNSIDRLDLKISHLRDKQLPLAKHPLVKEKLKSLGITNLKSEALVKGYLFQPAMQTKLPLPAYVNPKHLAGQWFRFHELEKHLSNEAYKHSLWLKLDKRDWISSNTSLITQANKAYSVSEMSRFLIDKDLQNRAHLFAALRPSGDKYLTVEKVFVVPSNWPASHPSPPL